MGDPSNTIPRLSLAPRRSTGFITDGKFFKFNSPYPQSSTKLYGAELSLDFLGTFVDVRGKTSPRRVGELALMYYYGRSDDHFDQSDLPLGDNPLADLIRFDASRDSQSHWLMAEWRWPLFAPAYRSKHLRLIQPQYSLGLGGVWMSTVVRQDGPPEKVQELAGFLTGSTQLRMAEVSLGSVDISLEVSVRMLAGQTYGIMGESALRLTYRR